MNTDLERLAQRIALDPDFLAAPLSCYAASHKLDDAALALRLGCDRDTLTHLRLCRNPEPLPPRFWQDIERIASCFHLDPDILAEIVRFGQSLVQLRQPTDVSTNSEPGLMLAAREDEDGENLPREEP